MKVHCLVFLTLLGSVSAGIPAGLTPQISIGVNAGNEPTSKLGGIEPTLRWNGATSVGGVDLEGGLDVTIKDVDDTPTSIWGKIKKSFPGFCDIEARGDMDVQNPDYVDLDVRLNGFGTAVKMTGTAYSEPNRVELEYVQMTKDIDTLGGTVTITPKYDLQSSTPDVMVGYAYEKTNFQIDAQSKKLTVAHSFANNQNISPSVNAAGDFSLSYSRDVDNGRLTTTWTPNDSVKLKWSDGEWETTVRAPIEGYYKPNAGVKVNMKRKVDVDWSQPKEE